MGLDTRDVGSDTMELFWVFLMIVTVQTNRSVGP